MADESRLWERLKERYDARKLTSFRIEHKFLKGFPDSGVIVPSGKTVWCELKDQESFGAKVQIEPEQINTLFKFARAGAPTYCLIQVGKNHLQRSWILAFPPGELKLWQVLGESDGMAQLIGDGHAQEFHSLDKVADVLCNH